MSPVANDQNVSNALIAFRVNLATELAAGQQLKVKLTGVMNPPTSNPTGTGFLVSTFDKDNFGVDKINKCTIEALAVK